MGEAWIIGNVFPDWTNWKEYAHLNLLAKGLKERGFNPTFITLDKLKIHDNNRLISYGDEIYEAPDIAILKTNVYGDYWKRKLTRLQSLGTLVINKPINAVDYDNKVNIYQKAEKNGIPIPKTLFIPYTHCDDNSLEKIDKEIGWPCIIKPNLGWAGAGITTVNSKNDMNDAIKSSHQSYKDILGTYAPKPTHLVVQEMIDTECMIVVIVVGLKIYASVYHGSGTHLKKTIFKNHRLSEEYNKKYFVAAFNPSDDLSKLVMKIKDTFDLNAFRIELFLTKTGYVLCEINTSGHYGLTTLISRHNVADDVAEYAVNLYHASVR
jgi:glutathione synthase/RimK-type ligase-like ATP-grasp enzyme